MKRQNLTFILNYENFFYSINDNSRLSVSILH